VYLQHAAETDRSRSAHHAAQQHYQRALTLLEKLPACDERDEREVALRIGHGSVLMQTSGWGAPEVEAAYARVRKLSEARGPGQSLLSALWHLWIFHTTRGDLNEASALADRLFALAGESWDPEALLQAHHARWSTLFALGDLQGTERHAREGLELCRPGRRTSLDYGSHETAICARVFCARALALGGKTDTAASICRDATTLARELDHPFTLAFTLMHVAAVHQTRLDAHASLAHAAESTRVAQEHGFGLMLSWATGLLGWSMAQLGEARQGVQMIEGGVASARATGSVLFQPHMLGLLASAQAADGRVVEALQTVDEAVATSDRTGERFYIPELYRLRGELRLTNSDDAGAHLAECDFRDALRLADEQGARQLALRAALSLARLWKRTGKGAEAAHLVLDARGRLAEGADLPDMADADALIAGRTLCSP